MSRSPEDCQDDFIVLTPSSSFIPMRACITETPAPGDSVLYSVYVCKGDGQEWVVDKRFSDFQNLVATLQSTFKDHRPRIPSLPRTHMFKSTNHDVGLLEKRRLGLNQFLLELLRSELADSTPVLAFLEMPPSCQEAVLNGAAMQRMQHGFRWTCLSHVLHFRRLQVPESLPYSFNEPFPAEHDATPTKRDRASPRRPSPLLEPEDVGFKVPNTSLTCQFWSCTGLPLPRPDGAAPPSIADDVAFGEVAECEAWRELSAFHWQGCSHLNLRKSLRCGATRFKAHFKKDCGRVRVAMNPVALFMDSVPSPQAFLGSGVLYSAEDVQIVRGLVFYDPKHGSDLVNHDGTNFTIDAAFRREAQKDLKTAVQVANSLRCKAQDARALLAVLCEHDRARALEVVTQAQEEARGQEGRDYDIGSWVDLELQRNALQDDDKPLQLSSRLDDAANGQKTGPPGASAPSGPLKPNAVTEDAPSPPAVDVLPVHLRVVDRDLAILLSFTVFHLMLRRWDGACEIIFLGADEFVALRCTRFSLHTWDAFREREEREAERRDEDSPRSAFAPDAPPHFPPFQF